MLRWYGSTMVRSTPFTATEPSSMSTRPATDFRVVVLPAPEGPRMTKNSPSWTSKLRWSIAVTLPYFFVIPRTERVPMSALHRPEAQALDQVALDGQCEDERWQGAQHSSRCREVVVGLSAAAQELGDGHCDGAGVGEDQREHVVVPGEDEGEERGCRDSRPNQGQSHHQEGALPRVAVQQGGLLQVLRHVLE